MFYLRDKRVVGVLLWNIFDRIPTAREVRPRGGGCLAPQRHGRRWLPAHSSPLLTFSAPPPLSLPHQVIRRGEQFDNLDDLKRIFRVSSAPPPSEGNSEEAGA